VDDLARQIEPVIERHAIRVPRTEHRLIGQLAGREPDLLNLLERP
jgi:hypothetical protein